MDVDVKAEIARLKAAATESAAEAKRLQKQMQVECPHPFAGLEPVSSDRQYIGRQQYVLFRVKCPACDALLIHKLPC